MADLASLENALVNADRAASAGDEGAANDARMLAAEIKRLRQAPQDTYQPTVTAAQGARIRQGLAPIVEDNYSRKYDPKQSTLGYIGNKLGTNIAGIGNMAASAASGFLPMPLGGVLRESNKAVTNQLMNLLGLSPEMKAPGPGTEFLGNVAADVGTNFLIPGGSTAQRILGGIGSATGREVGKEGGIGGEIAGSIVGGVAAPAIILSRLPVIKSAMSIAGGSMDDVVQRLQSNPEFMGRVREDALNFLAKDLRENPDDFTRVFAEAQRLEQAVPGLKLNLAQRFQAPTIVEQQRNLDVGARSQAAMLRGSQENALRTAMQESPSARAMAEGAIEDVTEGARRRVASLSDEIAANTRKAEQLSAKAAYRVDTEDLGERALAIRQNLLGEARNEANRLMGLASREAAQEGAAFNPAPIVERANALRSQPVWDEANFPAIFRKVQEWGEATNNAALPFEAIRDMRQAVNADIGNALKSNSPNARTQLHNLRELRNSIDQVVDSSPFEGTRNAYGEFNRYYRQEFAPRFLRGVNLAAERVGARGEPLLAGEKVFTQYFKPGGATNMARYLRLYGDNIEAMTAMKSAVIDRYAREVMDDATGLINPTKHRQFFDKYGQPIAVLERQGFNFAKPLRDSGKAFEEVVANRAFLEDEVSRINGDSVLKLMRDEFGKKSPEDVVSEALQDTRKMRAILSRMNDSQARGFVDFASDSLSKEFQRDGNIQPELIKRFLDDPNRSRSYMNAMARAYGGDAAREQMKSLRDIASIVERMDVTPVPPPPTAMGSGPKNILKDEMQKKIGLSYAVIGNMLRAVVAGRVSAEWAGIVLGGQAFATVFQNLQNEIYKQVLSDPGTSTRLLQLMKTKPDAATVAERVTRLLKHSPKIASFLMGLKDYPRLGLQAGANVLREQTIEDLGQ